MSSRCVQRVVYLTERTENSIKGLVDGLIKKNLIRELVGKPGYWNRIKIRLES